MAIKSELVVGERPQFLSSLQGCVSFPHNSPVGFCLKQVIKKTAAKAERPISHFLPQSPHPSLCRKQEVCLASYHFLSLLGKPRSPPTRKQRIHPSIVGIPLYTYGIPTYTYLQTIILCLLFSPIFPTLSAALTATNHVCMGEVRGEQ